MKDSIKRRSFLSRLSGLMGISLFWPFAGRATKHESMNPIKKIKPLGFQWETLDPFLFCVHHEDAFPEGNERMGPEASYLKGRRLGEDFISKDGFRMYHGKEVPGFPGHPHRGFETITAVRKGMVDHSDSMGAAGRYGDGDVQWMTAGRGLQHAEMFPLLKKEEANPMELFQIWLNLPKKSKLVEPHFKMLWREDIPIHKHLDSSGKETLVEIISGQLGSDKAPSPPPNSWAADKHNEVLVWNIKMQPGARFSLPAASEGINRCLYFYEGEGNKIGAEEIPHYHAVELQSQLGIELQAGEQGASILLLQGRPINEPVIQYGPFVMNSKAEIQAAFEEFHQTQFGGWPWPRYDQVHARSKGRFALHADGKEEKPT